MARRANKPTPAKVLTLTSGSYETPPAPVIAQAREHLGPGPLTTHRATRGDIPVGGQVIDLAKRGMVAWTTYATDGAPDAPEGASVHETPAQP